MNYELLSESQNKVLIKCAVCNRVFWYSKENVYKFHHSPNGYCGRMLHKEIKEKYGEKIEKKFFSIMRGAKNRATNKSNKDYELYHIGGWHYSDSFDFVQSELDNFVSAVRIYGVDNVTIDRIDTRLGYASGNVRWVPLVDNLKNKPSIIPVRCTFLNTGESVVFENCNVCGLAIGILPARVWYACKRENHIYEKLYKFEYVERCND